MDTIYNNEKLYDRFFELAEKEDVIANTKGQLLHFFHWLYDNDFLRNLTKSDYEWLIDEDKLSLPILKNHKIGIGLDIWENYVRIGFDPSNCFDKVSKCSIIAKFPLSKREEKSFYDVLSKILDKKSTYSKSWFKEASTSWCGEFATFGNVR